MTRKKSLSAFKSPAWRSFPLDPAYFAGVVSVIDESDGLRPCRLPHHKKHLFATQEEGLWRAAIYPTGVRLRMKTDATALKVCFSPLVDISKELSAGHAFDVVIDNRIVQVTFCGAGATEAQFDKIGKGLRAIEIWLPPSDAVKITGIQAKGAKVLHPLPDHRPMWVTWGSSLTHSYAAGSAARIWPATVARKHDLNLVSLGFNGNCRLEPSVAMVIRDLPARYISMKLGINAIASLSPRTYPPLVAGAVTIIREKHPSTPIALISPMACLPRETTPSAANYTLEGMRADMKAVYQALTAAGDTNLYYVNGMDFFNCEDIARYAPDKVHPNAEGIDLQAKRFNELVMPLLLGKLAAADEDYLFCVIKTKQASH